MGRLIDREIIKEINKLKTNKHSDENEKGDAL